jgi:outer membrane protein assembly factor BamB
MSCHKIAPTGRRFCSSVILWAAFVTGASGAPGLSLAPNIAPPTSAITVNGTGFAASEVVDIYFDATDVALAISNGNGSFRGIPLTIPKNAHPGSHWITAVGRPRGDAAQHELTVDTDRAEKGFAPPGKRDNPYENVLSIGNVAALDTLWSYATRANIVSSPAVANDVVDVGSYDKNVYAIKSGLKLWSFPTGALIEASPAVANGVVYVGSYDKNIYALHAKTGAKVWSFTTGNKVQSSPVVASGVVYFGSWDGRLYALKAATGAMLWSYKTGSYVISSPAVANGVVYVGSYDHNMYALNAATGRMVWAFPAGAQIHSSPAVANGVVFFGSVDHNVYAVDARTGAKLWTRLTGNQVYSSPAVANGVVYIGSSDKHLYALDARTCVKLWSFRGGKPCLFLSRGGEPNCLCRIGRQQPLRSQCVVRCAVVVGSDRERGGCLAGGGQRGRL